ncbi:Structural component of the gap junction, partial [Halocaridina rubra]
MHDVFGDIKSLVRLSDIHTDNNIFRLHYKATMFVLIVCSLLVTSRQYFGDPIDCVTSNVDPGLMDTYCWIHSTFTIPSHSGKDDTYHPHPGVGPNHDLVTKEPLEKKHHKYYQWVFLVLFLQALMFYIPRYFWKVWEGGKIKMLAADLNAPILDDDLKKDRREIIVRYFNANIGTHDFYAYKFFFCEALNFINVIIQIFITDRFLGGEFMRYGSDVVRISQEPLGTRNDPMDLLFPKVAKCTFQLYGASGSVEKHDGLCVLPLNILNEKIFIFIWFWFIVIAVFTALGLLYRLATIFLPSFRTLLLRTRSQLTSTSNVQDITKKCRIGDWFLLYHL